jgi:hypothetical protein
VAGVAIGRDLPDDKAFQRAVVSLRPSRGKASEHVSATSPSPLRPLVEGACLAMGPLLSKRKEIVETFLSSPSGDNQPPIIIVKHFMRHYGGIDDCRTRLASYGRSMKYGEEFLADLIELAHRLSIGFISYVAIVIHCFDVAFCELLRTMDVERSPSLDRCQDLEHRSA